LSCPTTFAKKISDCVVLCVVLKKVDTIRLLFLREVVVFCFVLSKVYSVSPFLVFISIAQSAAAAV
jgi:hypothetical protein